ncbi:MAG: hypothetical protein KBC46_10600 [Ferrovibrio sp.]|nr:hypothetical protein [Ferrovibrio sp.]
MAILSGQVAFEIDDDERLTTIVFLGPVSDQQVIELYTAGGFDNAAISGYNFLFDLRHTRWIPNPATIRQLALHMRQVREQAGTGPDQRRIAAVRRDNPEVYAATHGARTQAEIGQQRLRYFNDICAARLWLRADT